MLRVTELEDQLTTVRLKVEGRISSESSVALREVCLRCIGEGKTVQLDLAAVSSVTPYGVETLRALQKHGVDLLHVPPLTGELIVDRHTQ